MRTREQTASPYGNCYRRRKHLQVISLRPRAQERWHRLCRWAGLKGTMMGPAIALRLRQHLTLTPQVQQALRLLQMSALEFAQEMEQALNENPFLEENPDGAAAPRESSGAVDDVVVPQEPASPGVSD